MTALSAVNVMGQQGVRRLVTSSPNSSALFIRPSQHGVINVGLRMLTLDKRARNSSTLPRAIGRLVADATRVSPSGSCSMGTKTDIAANVSEDDKRPVDRSGTHFRLTPTKHPLGLAPAQEKKGTEWSMPREIWTEEEVNSIKVTHKEPDEAVDHLALGAVRFLRLSFDYLAGFKTGPIDEHKYLNRVIFLETVAGIPGMVAGALRHLHSLRRMRRDHGWIHTLLEEAENERMHLLTFLKLKKPGPLFRFMVFVSQGVMFNAFFLAYIVSPKSCHRFVGYIEEEAVHTYTTLLNDIDTNKLPLFTNLPAPAVAKAYWKLPEDAMFRDLVLAVRADEANHRVVNHTFADMHKDFKQDAVNPFRIQAKVTEYAEPGGVTPPTMASITDGDNDRTQNKGEEEKREKS